MTNERITTTLQALISEGNIASAIREEVAAQAHAIIDDEEMAEQFNANVTSFIDTIIDEAVQAIVETRGDQGLVASVIGTSYGSGLALGLAVGVLAGE